MFCIVPFLPKASRARSIVSMVKIEQLKKATKEAVKDIRELLPQLRDNASEHTCTLTELTNIVNDKKTVLMVVKDKTRIVGMATLYVQQKLGKRTGHIEDVVIHSDYRGQGLGEKIVQALISAAKKKKLSSINLTSRPERTAANKLYQKVGFELKKTNPYRMSL